MDGDERTWISLDPSKHPGVWVRVTVIDDRVTIVGVRIENPDGVGMDDLRSVPVHRFEANWNRAESYEGKAIRSKVRRAGELARMGVAVEQPKPPTKRELRLPMPKTKKYPDSFYVQVAMLYGDCLANGIRPGPALAEANGVTIDAVHRWFKEARDRGILKRAKTKGANG